MHLSAAGNEVLLSGNSTRTHATITFLTSLHFSRIPFAAAAAASFSAAAVSPSLSRERKKKEMNDKEMRISAVPFSLSSVKWHEKLHTMRKVAF